MLIDQNIKYFIKLSNGNELGPYDSAELANISASTIPLKEGEVAPIVIPKPITNQQYLFG
jgi:hypothetical protein